MSKHILLCIALLTVITACNNVKENTNELFSQIYSEENLTTQSFSIDAEKDTVLKGQAGTLLTIAKHTFVDSLGNAVSGPIQVELKEVFSTLDIVLSNLTTTSDREPLQTGGMIYINAKANGKQLQIAETKQIDVKTPTSKVLEGMQVYEGIRDSAGINWKNPVPINQKVTQSADSLGESVDEIKEARKETNIAYSVFDLRNNPVDDSPEYIDDLVAEMAWAGDGLKIKKDTSFQVDSFIIKFYKQKNMSVSISNEFRPAKGFNAFVEDQNTRYLFSLKKLGWANIDRLYDDPRSEQVVLITNVDNNSEFEFIYTTMVTEKMFLPGYQMENQTFSFTHSDDEKPVLPVGAKATIMATAYKNDKAYFSIEKITIAKEQTVTLHLNETTKEYLKKQLEKNL